MVFRCNGFQRLALIFSLPIQAKIWKLQTTMSTSRFQLFNGSRSKILHIILPESVGVDSWLFHSVFFPLQESRQSEFDKFQIVQNFESKCSSLYHQDEKRVHFSLSN